MFSSPNNSILSILSNTFLSFIFLFPIKVNLSFWITEFSGKCINTFIFSKNLFFNNVIFSWDWTLNSGFFRPEILNSSTSWFSNAISFSNAKIFNPDPWTFNEFHFGLTNNISYSLGINKSSTHWGNIFICFRCFSISKPSNSCIILRLSFLRIKDLTNILSNFCIINLFLFFNLFFILNICNPSNSWILFLFFGRVIIDVILISSIFWITEGSLIFSIIYSSLNSDFFLHKILIDCKCWQIFLYFFFVDIIAKAFISCISKTPSLSEIDSRIISFFSDFSVSS